MFCGIASVHPPSDRYPSSEAENNSSESKSSFKRMMPEKYKNIFKSDTEELKIELYKFMHKKGYLMVEPNDITLNFNKENGGDIKFSRPRRLRKKKGFNGFIKKTLYKLNNIIHFRRGPD